MYSYAFERIGRSWGLFIAFFLGLTLAVTLFTGTLLGADSLGYQTLQEAMAHIPVDVLAVNIAKNISFSSVEETLASVAPVQFVSRTEAMYIAGASAWMTAQNFTKAFTVTAIQNESILYEEADFVNATNSLGVNQTYIEDGSVDAGKLSIGDVLTIRIGVRSPKPPYEPHYFEYNLTVAGRVGLGDRAFSVAAAMSPRRVEVFFRQMILGGQARRPPYNLLIISDQTIISILNSVYNQDLLPSENVATSLLIWLDRESLVNPWDVEQSVTDSEKVGAQIANNVRQAGYVPVNLLTLILNAIQQLTSWLKIAFIVLALPVFFTAWYMGMTVSDVSLNLRRREIGLLFTKGFSKGQVLRLFISESLILGLVAGAIGILLGVFILPLVNLEADLLGSFSFLSTGTIAMTMVFSVAIAVLAVYRPARKASSISVVEAVREYVPREAEAGQKRRWPAVAMLLGTYKLVAYVLGFSLQAYSPPGRGLFVVILFRIGVFIDQILGYLAPVLFFWGFSKLFIHGSFKLQEALGRLAGYFMGDLSEIATENARRNVRRTAAVAFLVALIVGYGVSVFGGLASADDFVERSISNNVGADISIWMFSEENATLVRDMATNLTSVSSATVERWLFASTSFGTIQVRSIDPALWKDIAYHEEGWFTGASISDAFNELAASNETIILDRSLADEYGLKVGQNITVTLGSETYPLGIVALFGPERAQTALPLGASSPSFWSYIPEGLYNQTSGVDVAQTRILVKLASGVNGTMVAEEVSDLNSNIERVNSVETQRKLAEGNVLLNGPRRVQALGVPFALLTSSVGVALIATTSLKERRKEITLMSIKGFSYGQIVKAQMLENLGIIGFSILLGSLVGYVTTMGNVQSLNALPSLVARRVVFPVDSLVTILTILAIILASTMAPILIIVRRYSTSLEWRIRG